jgi:serine/threonine-protein kinase
MSPEQAQGTKAVDHRSDLWALAVIVYQAITGKLPFESEALGDLLMRIIIAPMPVPSAELPGLPPMFDRWWATAANRDPAQRFQSAKDLLDGLLVTFGQSQLTDMMDRNELRAVMDMPSAPRGGLPFTTPHPHNMTPNPAGTMPVSQQGFAGQQGSAGHPGFGSHPGFGGAPGFSAPFPGHGTPPPNGLPPHATTGAPLAQTFGPAPSPPKNRAPLVIGICAGVALLGGVLIAAALMARGHGREATAASPPAETTSSVVASATPTTTPAATAAPPAASVVLAPPANDPPPSEKEASAPSSTPALPGTTRPAATAPAFTGAPRFPGGARPAPTAAPKKPGSVDLGI